ncbi:UNVERIFIED_CONTAM: Ribosomal RNA small subunit methyltransferase H [Sesamum angustifolium]|uniref:Ribosomal RNA small subunit methyltransferase H n=1 Tax=Sesamum angustifolium TaxID=2727405 RepID=A0AAW2MKL3_9LAMI
MQIIQAHPEMEFYVGLDVDPVAHQIAQAQLNTILHNDFGQSSAGLQVHTLLKNFKNIKDVLHDIDGKHIANGVQGILMDLGMSSMQVNNAERGFSVLSDGPLDMRMNPQMLTWGEFTGLRRKARLDLRLATRVFQALRIAVNDELNTLKDSIHCCFESLDSGGRLAVISFHSLEDRIVKQAFLDIINSSQDGDKEERNFTNSIKLDSCKEKEAWMKQIVQGPNASILTKRPITPSESEERLNPRSRSAKLRVIEKI